MKKGIMTIALVAVMMLIATPAQAAWDTEPVTLMTSAELTVNAWEALNQGNDAGYLKAIKWAKVCTYFYDEKAQLQRDKDYQSMFGLKEAYVFWKDFTDSSTPPVADSSNDVGTLYSNCWAYSDVATCYFILGEAYRLHSSAWDSYAKQAYNMIDSGKIESPAGVFNRGLCASSATVTGTDFLYDGTTKKANVWEIATAADDGIYIINTPAISKKYPFGENPLK